MMKLTKNNKIVLGLAIGGGLAWLLNKYGVKGNNATAQRTSVPSGGTDSAETPISREGKIEYILANTEASAGEEKSGFGGDRFEYDPQLGYALPVGQVSETNSGAQMVFGHEGNLANEVFFNINGEQTDDPTDAAEAIMSEMTNEEVDIAYAMVKAKKNNPNLGYSEIMNKLNYGDGAKATFKQVIKPRIQNIKAIKKSPQWKTKWEARKRRFANKMKKMAQKMEQRVGHLEEKIMHGKGRKKKGRKNFHDEVINRNAGSMWGGYRNDGHATSATEY